MERLFGKYDSYSVKEGQKKAILDEVDAISESQLMNTKLDDWVNHFVSKFTVEIPTLLESDVTGDVQDQKVDARNLPDAYNRHFSRPGPCYIDGTVITYFMPFSGDSEFFHIRSSTFNHSPPRAEVKNKELIFRYEIANHNAEAVKKNFDSAISEIKQWLSWLKSDFNEFNSTLETTIRTRLQQRYDKLKKDQGMAAALGVPLRRRTGAPATYIAQEVKRKITPRPVASPTRTPAEPTLDDAEYNHILSVIKNMVLMIEKSPSAFKHMEEEHLRDHFLVQLNGQYEGQASGETFNFNGKTDILIKAEGKNIFIGECKFWKGATGFTDTITQLLGYVSWRDTKTAILLFNKNKNLTNVLSQIESLVAAHPNFIRTIGKTDETDFRFVLHQNQDKGREITLSVLVFDIPT